MDSEMIKKALPREGFRNTNSKRRKTLWNLSKFQFSEMQKRVADSLIKPVGFQDFWSQKSKMDSEMIKKALPREGFRNTISKRRETL